MNINQLIKNVRQQARYIHVSTGPGYRPRSRAPGHVRGPMELGVTYAPGHNQKKRILRALKAGHGPASLMARVNP